MNTLLARTPVRYRHQVPRRVKVFLQYRSGVGPTVPVQYIGYIRTGRLLLPKAVQIPVHEY
jgi:hypothetical protein